MFGDRYLLSHQSFVFDSWKNILGGIPEMIQENFQEMFLFLHAMKCVNTLLVYALFCDGLDSLKCSVVIFNRSDMTRIPVMGLNGILCRARKRRRVHVICFTWDTYTQTSVDMADCCISRLKVVFSWQRAAFQLRATKDIRSQLGNKLSSAYFLVYLHFAVCGLTV